MTPLAGFSWFSGPTFINLRRWDRVSLQNVLIGEQAKTSSPRSFTFTPRVSVQDGTEVPGHWASPLSSPLSSASTIDDWELSSPLLPALEAPQLSSTASGYLRTPSPTDSEGHYVVTSWGSPYPQSDSNRHRSPSRSSGTSDDSPLHQLEIGTRFLRPAPPASSAPSTSARSNLSIAGSAAVLANRARRPLRGLTEEWIRQHTANNSGSEPRHWLSDGTDDSEHSSLSCSIASHEAGWFDEANPRTPRPALRPIVPPSSAHRHSRDRSSNETLKPEVIHSRATDMADSMDPSAAEKMMQDASSIYTLESGSDMTTRPATPSKNSQAGVNGSAHGANVEPTRPVTPPKLIKPTLAHTRLRKKVPWRGKNILVLLPPDEERGQTSQRPMPLDTASTQAMLRSWEQLGYNTRGFDLGPRGSDAAPETNSYSRDEWPAAADIEEERRSEQYKVMLPDLNAWKEYVNELAEAKLRALGVTFAEEEPLAQSESPVPAMSRQASNQLPPFPFSPPLPTSSAISNGPHGFPFPPPFFQPGLSASQSPGIQTVASPVPIHAPGPMKYNGRASISVSPHEFQYLPAQPSPMGWSPHMLLQQHHGPNGSPSAMNMMSPGSPFSPDGMASPIGIHQRHQSLQYPMMPPTFVPRQDSTRASPRLEEVREDEEEEEIRTNPYDQSPAKSPEPAQFIQHNSSNSLQKEIDEAEYHLEEQFRSQLEHEDYSPHNEAGPLQGDIPADKFATAETLNSQGQSVHFSGIRTDSEEGPKLHHPQPHSRGHSLSQNPYYDNDEVREGKDESSMRKPQSNIVDLVKADSSFEVETNPSDLGTSAHTYDSTTDGHDRSRSTTSNPWAESESLADSNSHSRQGSSNSKSSLSKLNASAAEFKFNPKSNFTPGQFVFGGTNPQAQSFKPGSLQTSTSAPPIAQSSASSHLSVPSNTSSTMDKINPTAPVFSPQRSDFSFSSSGPKFNPDAKAFEPVRSSISTAGSGKAGSSDSIFGNINLGSPEFSQAAKPSKAVTSPTTKPGAVDTTPSSHVLLAGDASRLKKQFRVGDNGDGDEVPRFAEPTPVYPQLPPTAESELDPSDTEAANVDEPEATEIPADSRDDEDEIVNVADVTLASTAVSEFTEGKVPSEYNDTNDTKTTTSPFATSPDPERAKLIEFTAEADIHDFKHGKPLVDQVPTSIEPEKSATGGSSSAPVGLLFGSPEMVNTPFKPEFVTQPEQLESQDELGDESAGSPTPGPDFPAATVTEPVQTKQGSSVSTKPAPPLRSGLMASRFAPSPSASPSPVDGRPTALNNRSGPVSNVQQSNDQALPVSSPSDANPQPWKAGTRDLTFKEIDAVMKQINENDPNMGVKRLMESSKWRRPHDSLPHQRPRRHQSLKPATDPEDQTVDEAPSAPSQCTDGPVRRLHTRHNAPESDWDDAFSAGEQNKFEQRVQYFDGHVNNILGNLLASRLDPLENAMKLVLSKLPQRSASSRRGRRSISELQESDADDEDEELPVRRSPSPRRDRRLEQIRVAIMDVLSQHQMGRALGSTESASVEDNQPKTELNVMKALEEMKLQITENMPKFRTEDLRSVVEQAINKRAASPAADETNEKLTMMQATIQSLEERLHAEQSKYDLERSQVRDMEEKLRISESTRQATEERMTDLRRQLEQAETKVEIEIMNRTIVDQRTHDLDDRLRTQVKAAEHELSIRREAEDRLSEVQRLLRISCEEEDRLRAVILERDQIIKALEQSTGKASARLATLEDSQKTSEQNNVELRNRLNVSETETRESRQEARHWRFEAEQARDAATQQGDNLVKSVNENKQLRTLIDTLRVQLEENERIRDSWRAKVVSLQEDMARAAREITEENARRTKKEQALIARQEVLDARLQAETCTRERLEAEVARLEACERAGTRAVAESKRLEALLADVRNENHQLHQQANRAEREAQEARDSAASEVQRAQLEIQAAKDSAAFEVDRAQQELQEAKQSTDVETQKVRESVALELESARDQVNIVRADLEEEIAKLKAELDQVRLDADTANARHDMMLEEAQTTKETELQAMKSAKASEVEALSRKYQNEIEDLQARYERQLSNAVEDAQRSEQHLLERLSLSASKTEHLQDRVAHLEERLQIAQEAARAAAQAASQASKTSSDSPLPSEPGPINQSKQLVQAMQLPEKISPQALRESIMVLQEQLQDREQRIEELDQKVASLDPDAASKISKRDDEIMWLRELLAVRHGDLQDIITALSAETFNRETVKDAAIRLKANLQMEEQERERAMNGGSALNLPNIAATISKAATPRVAQAVGPIAAAFGNWRRSNQYVQSLSNVMSPPITGREAAPAKPSITPSQQSRVSGLLTPPTSGMRASPRPESSQEQPTAFGTTGRRYTAEQFANRSQGSLMTARQAEKMPHSITPPPQLERKDAHTSPMMHSDAYDNDAHMEEFDDASFFDD